MGSASVLARVRMLGDSMWRGWKIRFPGETFTNCINDMSAFRAQMPNAALPLAHSAVMWRELSFPTLAPTRSLVSALRLTDMRGQRDLKFPFGTFAVDLPVEYSDRIWSPRTNTTEKVVAIVAHSYMGASKVSAAVFNAAGSPTMRGARMAADERWLLLLLLGEDGMECWSNWPWPENQPLDAWSNNLIGGVGSDWTEEDICSARQAARLVSNLCLYVNSLGSLTPDSCAKQPTGDRKASGVTSIRYTIGREIKLPSEMHLAAESGRYGYRVRSRFIVRGHWRNQVCGAGRAEHKLIWIAPFWKGPAAGPELRRLYAVAETR